MSKDLTLPELQKEFARVAEVLQKEQLEAYDKYVADATLHSEIVSDTISNIMHKATEAHDEQITDLRRIMAEHRQNTQDLLDEMRAGRAAVEGQVPIKVSDPAKRAKEQDIRESK